MEKVLSVIIPTYNMEKYLHKCLDSLIVSDENLEKLEVLVVNDGSKDSSSQIAHEYELKFPKTFRVIDKENGNYGSCINRGLKETTGKYVKVLDADDYFDVEVLDKYIQFLNSADVDLIINDYCIFNENNIIEETYTFNLPTSESFTLGEIPKRMMEWLWHHGIAYKREILLNMGYKQMEGISYTDDEWVFKPMMNVHSIIYFPYILYYYLLGREGQTFDPNVMKSSFDKRVIVGKSMIDFYGQIINSCSSDANYFLTEKLKARVSVIYNFYLTKEYSAAGNEILKEFDLFIKKHATTFYPRLEEERGKFGLHNYIRSWREAGYKNTVLLRLRQMKFKLRIWLGKDYRHLHMPEEIKRR